jgi:hypothetical protein
MPVTVISLLSGQLSQAHQLFLGTLDGVTDEVANYQPQGQALSIAAVWAHHVEGEDSFLSAISGQPTVESSSFAGKTGFNQSQPQGNWAEEYPRWAAAVRADAAQLRRYTEAVFAASEKALTDFDPSRLEQTVDLGAMGQPSAETVISAYIIGHCLSIAGEISAIKGVQGLKGYPF